MKGLMSTERLKLRINLALHDSSIACEALYQAMKALSDEAKQCHVVLTNLQSYSRSVSTLYQSPRPPPATHQPPPFSTSESARYLFEPSLKQSSVAVDANPLSSSEAKKLAWSRSDLIFNH